MRKFIKYIVGFSALFMALWALITCVVTGWSMMWNFPLKPHPIVLILNFCSFNSLVAACLVLDEVLK